MLCCAGLYDAMDQRRQSTASRVAALVVDHFYRKISRKVVIRSSALPVYSFFRSSALFVVHRLFVTSSGLVPARWKGGASPSPPPPPLGSLDPRACSQSPRPSSRTLVGEGRGGEGGVISV